MCRLKKFAMEKKLMVLAKIREHKDILFGAFSDTLTKQIKGDKWKEVYDVARRINIVSAHKDWTYIRDTFWQNCRKYTFLKIENSKKGGKKCQLTQCDKIVLDIVGRESKFVVGIKLEEPPEEYIASSDFLENLASTTTTLPPSANSNISATPPSSCQARLKKVKKRPVSQLSLLSIKKKKLMIKRIELLNHKTILEIALLEKQLGAPCSSYTQNIFDETNYNNDDDTKVDQVELNSIKIENPVLNV